MRFIFERSIVILFLELGFQRKTSEKICFGIKQSMKQMIYIENELNN